MHVCCDWKRIVLRKQPVALTVYCYRVLSLPLAISSGIILYTSYILISWNELESTPTHAH